jgi:hypothetical protein
MEQEFKVWGPGGGGRGNGHEGNGLMLSAE